MPDPSKMVAPVVVVVMRSVIDVSSSTLNKNDECPFGAFSDPAVDPRSTAAGSISSIFFTHQLRSLFDPARSSRASRL